MPIGRRVSSGARHSEVVVRLGWRCGEGKDPGDYMGEGRRYRQWRWKCSAK